MIHLRILIILFLATAASLHSTEITHTDRATAQWLSDLITMEKGHLHVAGKPFGELNKARIPFIGKTEIQLTGANKIIVNQMGTHPLAIDSTHGLTVSLYHPMFDFLDDALAPDGLPSYTDHPKDTAMTTAGYRTIATHLHSHLTKLTGELPEHHRVMDTIGYVSESYTWKVQDVYIVLGAYDGNDTDGITFNIINSSDFLEGLRSKPQTTKEVYKDWGPPLPHRSSDEKLSIPEKISEPAKDGKTTDGPKK